MRPLISVGWASAHQPPARRWAEAHPTTSRLLLPLPSRERAGVRGAVALTIALGLTSCGTPTACLANRYDAAPPQARCLSGIQLPGNILKDTDPLSGSTAPVTVAE